MCLIVQERHTAENISKWTTEALEDMGLRPHDLMMERNATGIAAGAAQSDVASYVLGVDTEPLTRKHLEVLGVNPDTGSADDFV